MKVADSSRQRHLAALDLFLESASKQLRDLMLDSSKEN